jgi:hypothetical protein
MNGIIQIWNGGRNIKSAHLNIGPRWINAAVLVTGAFAQWLHAYRTFAFRIIHNVTHCKCKDYGGRRNQSLAAV